MRRMTKKRSDALRTNLFPPVPSKLVKSPPCEGTSRRTSRKVVCIIVDGRHCTAAAAHDICICRYLNHEILDNAMENAVFVTKSLCSSMSNKNKKKRAFVQATADAPAPDNAGIIMPKQPPSHTKQHRISAHLFTGAKRAEVLHGFRHTFAVSVTKHG